MNKTLLALGALLALSSACPSTAHAVFLQSPRATSGFFAPDDNSTHAVAVDSMGNIFDVRFGAVPLTRRQLINLPGVVGISAFFDPQDNSRKIIVARNVNGVGQLDEVYWFANGAPSHDTLAFFNTMAGSDRTLVSVAGYYSIDGFQHAVAATSAGNLYQFRFNHMTGQDYMLHKMTVSFVANSIKDIAAYQTTFNGDEHVVVATTTNPTNALVELYYQGLGAQHLNVLPGSSLVSAMRSIAGGATPSFGSLAQDTIYQAFNGTTGSGTSVYAWGTGGVAPVTAGPFHRIPLSLGFIYLPNSGGARAMLYADESNELVEFVQAEGVSLPWQQVLSLGTF